ncbi:Outer membrane protein TolC [Filimonas lacunae]|uniref:Outer membrane protein TolC n=1 Tax=Filimonas lacunae TaxID=477680 RepID=A0A173MQR5_9BACT|nr:TolC family protein [Filimonas lacunae]BAV10015.1 outer membrane efflux protein precursor [Filimonas lacunae]SIS82580.1 Outer membrane protein TolC [Filimonas lacunae]
MITARNGMVLLSSLLCTGVLAQTQPPPSPEVHQMSVRQTIDYAKSHNVQVKNALLDIQVQKESNRVTTAQALPRINGSGNFTDYLKLPVTVASSDNFPGTGAPPGTLIPFSFSTKYTASGSITLQQVLFDGQVFVGLQARKTSIDLSTKNAEITEENIRANIYKVYYQLVVSKTQMEQINANIEKLEKLVHDTKLMNENGFAEKLDVDRASVQLSNLQTEKIKTENTITNGYLGLKVLIGMPPTDSLALTDVITDEEIKAGALDAGIYKYSDRKDFQALQLTQSLYEYNIKSLRMGYLPTLSFNANYSENAFRNKFDMFSNEPWYASSYIGLSLNVPIFNGFSKSANIAKARLQLQQSQNQTESLKLSIDQDVFKARNDFRTSILTIDNQKKNMALAESVYTQTRKKYESGLASSTDLTNTQTELRIAQSNYISSLYDAIIARIDYLKATGQLQ